MKFLDWLFNRKPAKITLTDWYENYRAAKFKSGDTVIHVRSGNVYKIVSNTAVIERTMQICYIYMEEKGSWMWVRQREEMEDGRFEKVT